MTTAYLVEHYRPGLGVEGLRNCAARVRESAGEMEREGKPVRYLRATLVPTDESLLCVLAADSEELVREAYVRAGVVCDRITVAIADDDDVRPRPDADDDDTTDDRRERSWNGN